MSYKINNIDLTTFGIIPIQMSGQSLSTSGVFDFPARKGTTEHNWGVETEAFVSAADIEFEGRDIGFKAFMKAASRASLLVNLGNFNTLCKSGSLSFQTRVGTFTVFLTGEIEVVEMSDTILSIEAKFKQPVVEFLIAPGNASGGTGYLLDGYNLNTDFGIHVLSCQGRLNTAQRIEINTTNFYSISTYRQPLEINLNCLMRAASLADLTTQMGKLHGLLETASLKVLTFPDGSVANVYLQKGFKVSGIMEGSTSKASFTLTLRKP